MRILVTGSKGQLGIDLINKLSRNHEIAGLAKEELDITDNQAVLNFLSKNQFDVVINAAAYTNVDACETDFDNAYKVNAIGPKNLAIASQKYGFKYIHISTDYVFKGDNPSGYYEFDRTDPINKYGVTKLCGEEYIKNFSYRYFIIRTSWLYGMHGKNFVKTMLSLSETRDELKVVHDQIGSPTFTEDLVDFISIILLSEKYGIYHFSNSGSCTWNEFAKEIFNIASKQVKVLPVTTEEFKSPALRPRYSIMKNYMTEIEFDYKARHWREALKDFISKILV